MAKSNIMVTILGDASKLKASLASADTSLAGFGKRSAAMGATLTKKMTLPLVALGAGAIAVGNNFDKAYDTIRTGTGATGEKLEGLKDSFKNVISDVPASFEDASEAISLVNTRLGLTGKPLENVSKQVLELSRLTGTDLKTNVDALTRVFGDWGIEGEDTAEAMDGLFRMSQNTGIGIDDLSQKVVQFGSPLRNLGFTFEEATALFGKFNAEGVNTETVMAGLKLALGNFAKAGRDPKEAFQETITAMKNADSQAAATSIALKVFGQRASADMVAAVREGKFELNDLVDAMENGGDTILGVAEETKSAGEKFKELGNRISVSLEPVLNRLFEFIGDIADAIGPAIERVASAFGSLPAPIQNGVLAVGALAAAIGPLLSLFGKLAQSRVAAGMSSLVGSFKEMRVAMQGIAATRGISTLSAFGQVAKQSAISFVQWLNPAMVAAAAVTITAGIAWNNYRQNLERVNTLNKEAAELASNAAGSFDEQASSYIRTAIEGKNALGVANDLSFSLSDLAGVAIESGDEVRALTDDFVDAALRGGSRMKSLKHQVDQLDPGPLKDLATELITMQENGQITGAEMANFWQSMDEGAQGAAKNFDQMREALIADIRATEGLTDSEKRHAVAAAESAGNVEDLSRARADAGLSTEELAGATDELNGATEEAAAATEEAEASLQAYLDTIEGTLDPTFAYTDALLDLEDQKTAVADAQKKVTDLEALGAAGTEEHADAVRELEDAQRDQVRSAVALERAQVELTKKVQLGEWSFEQGATAVDRWAQEGRITAAQAKQVKNEMFYAAVAAGQLGSKNVSPSVDARTTGFWNKVLQINRWQFNPKYVDVIERFKPSTIFGPGGFFGQRAEGGAITAGVPYLVGELGPELVIPNQNGTVIPNNQLAAVGGGGSQVHVHFHSAVAGPESERWVIRMVEQGVAAGMQTPRLAQRLGR